MKFCFDKCHKDLHSIQDCPFKHIIAKRAPTEKDVIGHRCLWSHEDKDGIKALYYQFMLVDKTLKWIKFSEDCEKRLILTP